MQDIAVQSKDFAGSMVGWVHHFKIMESKHGKLVMPEVMVISEREDATQRHKQKRKVSNYETSVDAHAREDAQAEDKFLKAALRTGKIDHINRYAY